ncbi:hypothetical protein SAMN05421678_12725 [Actinopolymorpha cephalotaxi]|uniref:Uncharacterized protein n=1 Tax=Actinopolymorpha cephalotaxi TaxID=504797 RepID=A0A1I3BVP2_9ACTN|nr:hypothetical protein [Actinopolymorpha cephalotaxi]SFH66384.1 hypothetical protein SAMN05421678_12725 [Actinopolymorpha cephalotaxi]
MRANSTEIARQSFERRHDEGPGFPIMGLAWPLWWSG